MLHFSHGLGGESEPALIEAYLLADSPEFQQGAARPTVIICPGGGYLATSDREAEPVALRFNAMGYHAIVLRYRTQFMPFVAGTANASGSRTTPRSLWPGPLLDLGRAVALVRERAEEWRIDPHRLAICGFSAGGHLAAALATGWHEPALADRLELTSEVLRPTTVILGYPVLDYHLMTDLVARRADPETRELHALIREASFGTANPTEEQLTLISPRAAVSAQTVPCFLWHTADDALVYVENSLDFARALADHAIPFELHIFPTGPHGLSLADATTANSPAMVNPDCAVWIDMARTWLRRWFAAP